MAYGAGEESESVMSSLGPESESPSENKHMHMMHLVDTYVLVVNVKSSMLLASCYIAFALNLILLCARIKMDIIYNPSETWLWGMAQVLSVRHLSVSSNQMINKSCTVHVYQVACVNTNIPSFNVLQSPMAVTEGEPAIK